MRQDGAVAGALSPRAPVRHSELHVSDPAAGRDKDTDRAFHLLEKLKGAGDKVDLAMYNCLLDACVCAGDLARAKELTTTMHTVFAMVDQLGIDVCSEEILFSTLLEVCVHFHERRCLQELLAAYGESGGKPSQHLYGALIKASSVLKRVHKCHGYAQDVVQECAMMPNDRLHVGCSRLRWRALQGRASISTVL